MSYYNVPLFQIYHSSREYYFHLCTAQWPPYLQRHMSPNEQIVGKQHKNNDIGTILLVPTLCANTKFSKVDFVSKETSTSFWTLFSSSFNWPFDDVVKKNKPSKTIDDHIVIFCTHQQPLSSPYMPPFLLGLICCCLNAIFRFDTVYSSHFACFPDCLFSMKDASNRRH